MVYEEEVEGNITRFLAIFNSAAPETIGPVRSVRLQDPESLADHGIFAYSGGAADPVDAINAAPVHAVDNSAAIANGVNGMERDARATAAPVAAQPVRPRARALLARRRPEAAAAAVPVHVPGVPPPPDADLGEAVISTRVGFLAGYDPTYRGTRASGTWKRLQLGQPHIVVGGAQIAPANVVVQFTQYDGVSNGQTVGEGDCGSSPTAGCAPGAGSAPTASNRRATSTRRACPILLHPGRTWVELLPVGYAVDVQYGP